MQRKSCVNCSLSSGSAAALTLGQATSFSHFSLGEGLQGREKCQSMSASSYSVILNDTLDVIR